MKKAILLFIFQLCSLAMFAQINTDRVLTIGRNALYFEDYVLSIQYFNQVIKSKPWLAVPYFYRAVAKINLDDYKGAEEDFVLNGTLSWYRHITHVVLPVRVRRNLTKQ